MSLDDSMGQLIEVTKLRILHALEIFPFIAPSMLNMAIGTSTPAELWRPCLAQLVEEGKVVETNLQAKSPTGRNQAYTVLHLAKHEYSYGNV